MHRPTSEARTLRRRAILRASGEGYAGWALREAARVYLTATTVGEEMQRLGALPNTRDAKPQARVLPVSAVGKGWYGDYDSARAVDLTRNRRYDAALKTHLRARPKLQAAIRFETRTLPDRRPQRAPRTSHAPRAQRTVRTAPSRGDPSQGDDDSPPVDPADLRRIGREAGFTHISEPLIEELERLTRETL